VPLFGANGRTRSNECAVTGKSLGTMNLCARGSAFVFLRGRLEPEYPTADADALVESPSFSEGGLRTG